MHWRSEGKNVDGRNKRLVLRAYDELWNKGNVNAIDEYVSPDFVEQ